MILGITCMKIFCFLCIGNTALSHLGRLSGWAKPLDGEVILNDFYRAVFFKRAGVTGMSRAGAGDRRTLRRIAPYKAPLRHRFQASHNSYSANCPDAIREILRITKPEK
jgi:hypothetical protein